MGVVILKPRRDQRTHPRERFPHNDISRHSTTDRTPTGPAPDSSPSRDAPRDAPPGRPPGTPPGTTRCPVCRRCYTPVGRQLYYSTAPAARPRSAAGTSNPDRRSPSRPPCPAGRSPSTNAPTAATGTLGEQRCESCGTFARRVGIGGACPNCDGPVARFPPARPDGGHHRQEITSPSGHRKSQARLALCTVPVARTAPTGDPQTPGGGPGGRVSLHPRQFRVTT